jgi:hypothetical protein
VPRSSSAEKSLPPGQDEPPARFKRTRPPVPQTPFRNLKTDNEKATENTFRWLFSLLVQIETLLEAINTSAGVYQLLLTREEGVALGANVNDDVLLGGAGLNDIAAGTADRGLLVVGMDALFHVVSPLSTDMFTYLQQS